MDKKIVRLAIIRTNTEDSCPFGLNVPYGCRNAGDLINKMAPLNSLGDASKEEKEAIAKANNRLFMWHNPGEHCVYAGKLFPDRPVVECNWNSNAPGITEKGIVGAPFYSKVYNNIGLDGLTSYPLGYYGDHDISRNMYYGLYSLQGNKHNIDLIKLALVAKNKKPEAPKYGPFGEYAWSSNREAMPEEDDTEIEKEIYKQLHKHFLTHNREGLPEMTALFLSMLMELGWYKNILHKPVHKVLYRGVKINSKKELADILNLDEKEIDDNGGKNFKEGVSIPVFNGFSTSWSFRKGVSKDFSNKGKRGFAVTLVAEVSENPNKFIAGPGGLYDVDGISKHHLEKETVGLEPIKIKRIEWERIE